MKIVYEFPIAVPRLIYIENALTVLYRELKLEGAVITFSVVCRDEMQSRYGECYKFRNRIYINVGGFVLTRNFTEGLITVCHEMVHARQYHKGWLKIKRRKSYWHGEYIPDDSTTYELLPWEEHAYRMERVLHNIVVAKIGHYDDKHSIGS